MVSPGPDAVRAYDDSVYCFNGCYVVSREGRLGVIDSSGRQILAPEWDTAEFLEDDIALLSRHGVYYLSTDTGRIFAESADPEMLEKEARMRLNEVLYADYQAWNEVLDQLESLSQACLAGQGKRPGQRIVQARERLLKSLSHVSGTMTPEQESRLDAIVNHFSTLYP